MKALPAIAVVAFSKELIDNTRDYEDGHETLMDYCIENPTYNITWFRR